MKTFLTIAIVFISALTFSQEKTIKGTVTDETGEPLFGVSISEKGTSNGVTSDLNGKYTIKLKNDNGTLVFSYLGYKKIEKTTKGKSLINLQMEADSEALDEVVITKELCISCSPEFVDEPEF